MFFRIIFVCTLKLLCFGFTKPGSYRFRLLRRIYAEYVERLVLQKKLPACEGMTANAIYNAFVLPYCFEADNSQLPPDDGFEMRPYKMRFIGYCHGNWKNLDAMPGEVDYRPYHRIAGILLDVKSVMQNYCAFGDAQKMLATCILRENSNHSE